MATRCRVWRNIWGGGFYTRAGIRIAKFDCSTGGGPGGWGAMFTSRWLWMDPWDTCKPTCYTSRAVPCPSICARWIATRRLAAEQIIAEGGPVGWTNLLLDPAWTFFRTYLLQRGFLDGMEGLAIAHMAALYNFLKYAKVRFMRPER